jgi:hypothetical protein
MKIYGMWSDDRVKICKNLVSRGNYLTMEKLDRFSAIIFDRVARRADNHPLIKNSNRYEFFYHVTRWHGEALEYLAECRKWIAESSDYYYSAPQFARAQKIAWNNFIRALAVIAPLSAFDCE